MFQRVLVANRGEIACRVLRTCERLGVETVAVFSDVDVLSPHVALADQAVRLGAAPLQHSYLNIPALVAAIEQTGADAVHPGYGLLSESAEFAEAVAAAGAVFVGPSPSALRALGDKIRARDVARSVGVEPPPGSDAAVTPQDIEATRAEALRIGYPVLVKAAGGGGGIGMQVVAEPAELERALQTCAQRGQSAFGDARVYLERYLQRPRHIEVQVLRGQDGPARTIFDRECSVQRRHQKLIEECLSPAPFLSGEAGLARRRALYESAARIVEAVEYVGAATVEFVANDRGELFFLEVNARLQVEHPVTELVSGLDLVEQQLRLAAGENMSAVPALPEGHAIEARLYAEDPDRGFIPQPGRVVTLEFPEGDGIRIDAGIVAGSEVTPHYDPLLAKIVAHAPTRAEAVARLDRALDRLKIEIASAKGPRHTNRAFLRRVLQHPSFIAGDYDTALVGSMLSAKP